MFIETQKRDGPDIVEFISQPCGPRKLAKAFEICSERRQRRRSLLDVKGDLLVEPEPTHNPGPPDRSERPKSPHSQLDHQVEPDHPHVPLTALNEDNYTSHSQQTAATKILIVDDNAINVRVLVEFMKKLGCDNQTASNGLEALDFFKANASSIAMILMGTFK